MFVLFEKNTEKTNLLLETIRSFDPGVECVYLDSENGKDDEKSIFDILVNKNASNVPDEWCHGFINNEEKWNVMEWNISNNICAYQGTDICKITFYDPYIDRNVKYIEWYDKDNKHFKTDYFDKNGFKDSTSFFNDGIEFEKVYYEEKNKKAFMFLRQQNSVVQYKNGRVCNTFRFPFGFMEGYGLINKNEDEFIVTSPSILQEFLKWNVNGNCIPIALSYEDATNMEQILMKMYVSKEVYCIDSTYGKNLGEGIYSLSLIKPEKEISETNKSILIMTNTDILEGIEYLTDELEEFTFNIGANTMMSPKLMRLGEKSNVRLFPVMSDDKYRELLKNCSFYMDINYFEDIRNVVELSYLNDMVILGIDGLLHDLRYTNERCIFKKDELEEVVKLTSEAGNNRNLFENIIIEQRKKAMDCWKSVDVEWDR